MLEMPCVVDPVEAGLAGQYPFAPGTTSIGEFLAVFGADLGDPEGGGLGEAGQETLSIEVDPPVHRFSLA